MKYFSRLLSGYWASYRIQLKVGNINFEWLQCIQHFVKCPTDIFSLYFTAVLWEGSAYIICICRKRSWKSKMLIRTSQHFHVLEYLEYSISVVHWGKWMRILAVKGNRPKVPGRPGSGQICNLFTTQQCAYNGIYMLSLSVGFLLFFFSLGLFIFFLSGITSSCIWLFFPLKRSSSFLYWFIKPVWVWTWQDDWLSLQISWVRVHTLFMHWLCCVLSLVTCNLTTFPW